jgi:hypothetical protein
MTVIAAVRQTEAWSGLDIVIGIALLAAIAVAIVWGVRRFLNGD